MKLLVDMNLTPRWVESLQAHGWESVHWGRVGDAGAKDHEICRWARERGFTILTNDLDFPQILAHTRDTGPSVVLLRGEPLTPESRGGALARALRRCEADLERGAILSLDWGERFRVRLLPLA